ncbi:hypothetical protein NKY39_06520 [Sinorhizobium meliloti]|uniref:hypothetical protein n=1 Tax=Rhizobium meliloti TaxID=382 RepID=UPI003D652887
MTIDDLLVGSAAYFFKRGARITKSAIRDLFSQVRESVAKPSNSLFRHERVNFGGATYSAICFSYQRTPAFVRTSTGIFDTIHGFLMIVEKDDFVAVIKSGLDLSSAFKGRHLKPVGRARVERAVATTEAKFEQVALRNMSASKQSLRAKVFEAADLENAMPLASASRFVTKRFRVRRDDGHVAATPSTGRIAKRADRGGYEVLIEWASDVIDQLGRDAGEVAAFIRGFARSVELEHLAADVGPTYLAIDVPELTDRLLGEEATIRFVVASDEDEVAVLDKAACENVLQQIELSYPLRNDGAKLHVRDVGDQNDIGMLKVGKHRIALSKLAYANIESISVERRDVEPGADAEAMSLRRYIDKQDLFLVLFSDPSLAYVNGELFRDEAILSGGAEFLRHIIGDAALVPANSEKGTPTAADEEFTPHSVFRILADSLAPDDNVLVCDDLGDEWADFIGLCTDPRRPSISFYHAKHGDLSLGASPFHVSVSQAEKNLGRLSLASAAMPQKYAAWNTTYNGPNVATAIQRVVRGGDIETIEAQVNTVRAAPELRKRMVIVTSSLSRAAVAQAFQQIAAGALPSAHFVQLYWLLTSYFSACAEVGAVGYIICQP